MFLTRGRLAALGGGGVGGGSDDRLGLGIAATTHKQQVCLIPSAANCPAQPVNKDLQPTPTGHLKRSLLSKKGPLTAV